MLQLLGDCLVLLDLPLLGISVALREGGWGEGGWVWIISGTILIFLLSEQAKMVDLALSVCLRGLYNKHI